MAPAGQRNRCLAAHDSEDEQELPSFDGTLTNLNGWLDDLNDSEHLLEAEIVTLLHTGCAISRSGRTVACSRAHVHLKSSGVVDGAGFNVLAPPPLDDGFAAYYDQVQAEIEKKDPKHATDTCKRFNDLRPKPPAKDDTKRPRKMRTSASSRSTWTWSHRSTRRCSRKSSSSSRRKELERGMSRRQDAPAFDSCDCSSSSPLALPPKPLVRG